MLQTLGIITTNTSRNLNFCLEIFAWRVEDQSSDVKSIHLLQNSVDFNVSYLQSIINALNFTEFPSLFLFQCTFKAVVPGNHRFVCFTPAGEKPFSCFHCSRAFADRSNLRAHLQTHSEMKRYQCACCPKTFSRISLLAKHQEAGCPVS